MKGELEVRLRLLRLCSLTTGAFTLSTGCSVHGCGCNHTKDAYMFREFVIYDNDQFYAEYIRWCRRIHGERRTPAPLMYPDAALLLVLAPNVQAAPFTDVLECVSILLLTSQKMDKRLIGSLLSSGVPPRLTEFKGKHLTVSGRIFT